VAVNKEIRDRLQAVSDNNDAAQLQRYFKTGPGDYGEGDRFIGVRVGPLRKLAREFHSLSLEEILVLLKSPYHEERMLALLIMTEQFARGSKVEQKKLFDLYLDNLNAINNWDLVDVSAPRIVGAWLEHRSRKPLYRLARSSHLWSRRVAMMATLYFIKDGDFDDALAIADILKDDEHDLIHKAVGWMLREVGNKDRQVAEQFLASRYKTMPRTMLRYAVEKFPQTRRKRYLDGKI
jgi:3-methyladenine DNA glycosylase AlkD